MLFRATILALPFVLGAAMPAAAQDAPLPGLTVKMGESWIFKIVDGQPAEVREAKGAKPGEGELSVSLTVMVGPTMVVTNNSKTVYNYHAFLDAKPGSAGHRTSVCTLLRGGFTAMENWQQRVKSVRIADFVEAREGEMGCQ